MSKFLDKFVVGTSPLTGAIYLGRVNAKGDAFTDKRDAEKDAVVAYRAHDARGSQWGEQDLQPQRAVVQVDRRAVRGTEVMINDGKAHVGVAVDAETGRLRVLFVMDGVPSLMSPKEARKFAADLRRGIHIDPQLGEIAADLEEMALKIQSPAARA